MDRESLTNLKADLDIFKMYFKKNYLDHNPNNISPYGYGDIADIQDVMDLVSDVLQDRRENG